MKKTNRSQARLSGKRVQVFKSEANLGSARLRAIPFALAIVFGSTSSFADPSGAVVADGQAAISAANGITTVHQMTDRAVVNWQSFNVNAGEAVKFVQPSSTAAILNRVTGGSVSNINGLVEGNGRVYLINPNGIVVGANGVVNVNGGFVASTKSLANSAFMSGGALVFTGESTGSIQILGKVQSAQGDVILIAPKIAIEKTGSLIAGQTIKLVAANEVELSNGKFTVKPKAGDAGQLTVEGALEAAKVQLAANNNNLGALAINTTGTIRATGTQINSDGSVSIIATGDGGNINISGNIRSEKGDGNGGAVTVLADNNIGVSGTINAISTDAAKKGGDIIIGRDVTTNKLAKATDVTRATLLSNKGFVETSAHRLDVNGVTVKAGLWLLDPDDIEITDAPLTAGYTTQVSTATITNALNNGTSITLDTATGTTGVNGNILVTTAINATNTTNTDATLTLIANNGIKTNASIIGGTQAGNTGKINVNMTALGSGNDPDSGIKITKDIDVTGNLTLTGTANVAGGAGVSIAPGTNGVTQTLKAGGDLIITGTSNFIGALGYGVCISSCGPAAYAATTNISSTTGKVSITGNTQTSRGVSFGGGAGIGTHTYNINAAQNVEIKGTTQGKQSGATAYGVFENVSAQLNLASTTGSILIDGNASADTLSTSGQGVGLQGNVSFAAATSTISGKGRTSAPLATKHGAVSVGTTASAAQQINVTSGDLVISGSGGAYGLAIGAATNTTINNSLRNIKIEGTGTSDYGVGFTNTTINAKNLNATGVATTTGSGVQFSSGTNTLNTVSDINGTAVSGVGILKTGTLITNNNLTLVGSSTTGGGFQGAGVITASNGTVSISGSSTSGIGVNGTGNVTASLGNILIEGISGNTGGYATTTNGPINASGDITIKGIGTAKHGVWLGSNVAGNDITSTGGKVTVVGDTTGGGGAAGSGTGSAVTGFAVIKADKNVSITGKTFGYYSINGLGNITSTNGGVTIDGYSRDSRGVSYDKTITATNGDIKVIGVSGNASLVGSGNEHGVYFSGLAKGKNVTIDGTSINSVGTFIGSVSTNIDASDGVTVLGKSTSSIGVNLGSANGTAAFRATIKSGGDTTVNGTGLMNGVKIWETSSIIANNINITGNAVTTNAAQVGNGVDFQRYSAVAKLTATKDINIEGTVSGLGSGSGIKTSWSGQNGNGPVMNAGGNFSLRGNNRAAASNTQAALYAESGMQVTAGKNIVVQAETNNNQANAMNFYSLGDMYRGNASFVSTGGDVLIQANQGSIYFNNQQPSALGQLTDIMGRNITIDNTGAGMAIGAGTAVTGTGGTKGASIGTGIGYSRGLGGVVIADGRKLTASQNISISGATKDVNVNSEPAVKPGLYSAIYNTGKIEATSGTASLIAKAEGATQSGTAIYNAATGIIKGGSVVLDGTSTLRHGVSSFGAITSTIADVNIKGSTSAANNSALYGVLLNAPIQSKSNLSIVGTGNNTHGVYLQGTIAADGSIIVDGTTGTTATATTGQGVVNFAKITAKGKDANGHAIDITGRVIGGALRPAVNFQAGSEINNESSGGSTNISATQGVVYLTGTSKITNERSAGAINITAGDGTSASTAYILSSLGATITQKSNAGINMTTDGVGNLTVAKIINNGSGDVILAAGKQLDAGDGSGGQIKTVTGNNVGGTGTGKLYVYTGSAAGTGLLQNLTGAFSTLSLSDYTADDLSTIKQNAAANVAYTTGSSRSVISDNSANTQVMFREKVAIDSSSLNGAALGLTYGDADTNLSQTAALFSKMQAALRQNNLGTTVATSTLTNPSTSGANTFRISKAAVINDMTGSLTSPAYSTSQHLTATTHNYGMLTGTNYTTSLAANKAQVVVGKLPVQVFAQYTSLNYTGALLTQNQPNHPFINLDKVVLSGLATGTAVGSYLSALRASGDDLDNYEVQFVNDNLVIAYSGESKAPTPPQTYTRIAGDVVNLAPVSFAVGVTAATAAGDEADPNICYAWGQRNGGSVTVHTVLKPSYLGLRHAKTDTQEAMSNSGGSSSHAANPCENDVATNVATANNI